MNLPPTTLAALSPVAIAALSPTAIAALSHISKPPHDAACITQRPAKHEPPAPRAMPARKNAPPWQAELDAQCGPGCCNPAAGGHKASEPWYGLSFSCAPLPPNSQPPPAAVDAGYHSDDSDFAVVFVGWVTCAMGACEIFNFVQIELAWHGWNGI